MIKTGILGGTFDPVHNGHLHIALAALEQFELDELWFLPNGNPPHKDAGSIAAPTTKRVEMLNIAVKDYDKLSVCTYEADRSEVSYSYDTMEHLTKMYPDRRFYFIIGGDSLDYIDHWREPQRLMRCCTILVAVRNRKNLVETQKQMDELSKRYECDLQLIHVEEYQAASRVLREDIRSGHNERPRECLPKAVFDYISEHQLYKSE